MRQWGVNNLPKVVAQQRHGRGSNPRPLDRKSDALPVSHRTTPCYKHFPAVGEFSHKFSIATSGKITDRIKKSAPAGPPLAPPLLGAKSEE